MIEIKIGDDYLVESTGSLITFDNLPIKISIDEMTFQIIFVKDSSEEKLRSQNTVINDKLMEMKFFNFDGEMSYRNKPQEILTGGNKTYYLDLIISALGTERKLLEYTILSKKNK